MIEAECASEFGKIVVVAADEVQLKRQEKIVNRAGKSYTVESTIHYPTVLGCF